MSDAPAPLPRLAYSPDEAAEVAAMGKTALYEAIAAGELVARKRGRSTIILVADLAAYLAALPAVEVKQ